MKTDNKYLLLQVNDALFPIGGYSHSYGMETYIQKDLITDAQSAEKYIRSRLENSVLYGDLLTVRLAYEYSKAGKWEELKQLEQMCEAAKIPSEIREASKKLGSRFFKTVQQLSIDWDEQTMEETSVNAGGQVEKLNIWQKYILGNAPKKVHHTCVYGVFCAAAGIGVSDAISHFLYAQTSAMVTNCVKSIPLSQTAGQKILQSLFGVLSEMEAEVMTLDEDMLFASTPGFDIRCMQHEALYSRIYMS